MGGQKTRNIPLPNGISAADPLGATVGSFANRIKRRLKEQEDKEQQSQKETELRHARMLQALSIMRRALQETGQISLGERFCFDLDIGDWEGWPRLSLNLIDTLEPSKVDRSLVVTAHDRKNLGAVELRTISGQLLGHVQLRKADEMGRVPLVLKKSVRAFLDDVADYVLNPSKPTVVTQIESDLIEPDDEIDPLTENLKKENLFSDDDYCTTDNSVVCTADAQPLDLLGFESKGSLKGSESK